MNSVAFATHYPVSCPGCQTITSRRASELLQARFLACRGCDMKIELSESQLNRMRRTIADLGDCQRRSAEYCPAPVDSDADSAL